MNAGRFLSLVAERALAAGRPLHTELEGAAPLTGGLPPAAVRAMDFARAGKLGEALLALSPLGFDPLLADAAALRPEVATEVSLALARLPRRAELLRPLVTPVVYLALIVLFEAQVAALLSAKILPSLGAVIGPSAHLLSLAPVAGWAGLGVALAAIAALAVVPGLAAARRPLFGLLDIARVCATFAPLAAAGVPAEEAFNLARVHAPGLADELGRNPKAAFDWHELSAHFSERAVARASRVALAAKGAGTAIAVLLAALILASVYLTLPALSTLGGAP